MKYVFITGSSKGLGFEIAAEFAKIGYKVILHGRDKTRLNQKVALLDGNNHLVFAQDYLDDNAINNTKEFFISQKIVPNIIIHSLGAKLENDSHPIDPIILQKTLKLNLQSAIEINNLFMPYLEQNRGYIVHIGSLAGIDANASPCYSIAKAALHTYIKNSARFYAKKGVTIFGIIPGVLGHKGSDWDKKRVSEPAKYEDRIKKTLLNRFLDPNEIAKYVVALIGVNNSAIAGSLVELLNE